MGGDSLEGWTAVTGAVDEWLGLTCFLWRALQFWNHTWNGGGGNLHHVDRLHSVSTLAYQKPQSSNFSWIPLVNWAFNITLTVQTKKYPSKPTGCLKQARPSQESWPHKGRARRGAAQASCQAEQQHPQPHAAAKAAAPRHTTGHGHLRAPQSTADSEAGFSTGDPLSFSHSKVCKPPFFLFKSLIAAVRCLVSIETLSQSSRQNEWREQQTFSFI